MHTGGLFHCIQSSRIRELIKMVQKNLLNCHKIFLALAVSHDKRQSS